MLKTREVITFFLWTGAIAVLLLAALKISYAPTRSTVLGQSALSITDKSGIAQEIIENRLCPCGCGKLLPGSSRQAACFGCSVGKAEVSRIVEGLSEGRTPDEITRELNEPVLVDVFSDYTDERLSEVWESAKRSAGQYDQHRVVLRALGLTGEARRAIKLAECARAKGMFYKLQEALIEHPGPWDERTLIDLGIEHGMTEEYLTDCLQSMDIEAQTAKDRQHAEILKIGKTPVVSVNRKLSLSSDEDLRRAILKELLEKSI